MIPGSTNRNLSVTFSQCLPGHMHFLLPIVRCRGFLCFYFVFLKRKRRREGEGEGEGGGEGEMEKGRHATNLYPQMKLN